MVIDEKALVRELKEAYKGWGYTVMVTDHDKWVFRSADNWVVMIDGQDNVPNEVLALIVLHMGHLPRAIRVAVSRRKFTMWRRIPGADL